MTRISVIMPAFRAEALLPRVLPPLLAMQARGEVAEVIVVDDRSPDRTAEVARGMGARVIVLPANGGPGVARNLAAEKASGDVLWFVDSDVVAHDDAARRLHAALADPSVAAVIAIRVVLWNRAGSSNNTANVASGSATYFLTWAPVRTTSPLSIR